MGLRSCWTCNHQSVCYARKEIEATLDGFRYIALSDVPKATGTKKNIFEAIGGACTQYEPSSEQYL
jgi:hypothetical protein